MKEKYLSKLFNTTNSKDRKWAYLVSFLSCFHCSTLYFQLKLLEQVQNPHPEKIMMLPDAQSPIYTLGLTESSQLKKEKTVTHPHPLVVSGESVKQVAERFDKQRVEKDCIFDALHSMWSKAFRGEPRWSAKTVRKRFFLEGGGGVDM